MVRPRSSSKAPKQRAGAGPGKRKHGGAPSGGGGGRPAKQSRREGRSKPVDRDVYEAEDSDPDEVKHAERFDQVDNYEYELPSDFEDEEIDEDTAFTEEDKKKFGAWFEKEVSADEDEGDTIGDDDGEDWDDEDEDGDDDDDDADEDRGRGSRRNQPKDAEDGDVDDDDDLFLGGDDDDDDDDLEEEEDGEDEGEDEDDERHRAMLREVLEAAEGGTGSRKKARRDPNAAVVSEAYPESEYNLNPGAASAGGLASLSIADLLKGLAPEERRKLGAARRLLEKVGGAGAGAEDEEEGGSRRRGTKGLKPVSVPLPGIIAERQERKAGYEAASKEVSKWLPIVKANREAPTLRLVSGREDVPRVTTTAALVAQHTPSADNALEAEVAALLEQAGAANTEAIEEAEEQLALKALSLEEARERRERLAKMRSLLFYHELKARRLKAIKSKEYHRHLAKASKRKAAKLAEAEAAAGGEDGDVDAEKVAAIEAEFQRAKERLTLRHRNSSRWARRALKRGQLQVDAGTKAALAEQLQLGQQLRRKIEGRKGSGSDDDGSGGSTSASDDEMQADGDGGAAGRGGSGRLRSAALDILAGKGPLDDGEVPKKGLLALPFMKRALEKRRLEARQDAEQLLRELEEQEQQQGHQEQQEDDGVGAQGTSGNLLEALVGYGVPAAAAATATAGRRRFGAGSDAAAVAAAAAADADAGDDSDLDSDDAEDAEAKAERLGRRTREAAAAAAATKKQQQKQVAGGKKGRKGSTGLAAPSAADQEDLDAAVRAGAAGRGLLVSSSDAGLDAPVAAAGAAGRVTVDEETEMEDADEERRESGRAASTRAAAAAGGGGNIMASARGALAAAAAQQGSVAAGGGRAALFEGPGDAAQQPKFIAAKKFGGAKPGYAFKKGPQGLGYYFDAKAAAAVAAAAGSKAAAAAKAAGKQQQGKGKASDAKDTGIKVAGQEEKQQPASTQAAAGKGAQQPSGKSAAAPAAAAAADVAAAAGSDGEDNGAIMRPATGGQRDLIRQAFAGDDVEAEFAAEKAAAVAGELPQIEEPSALPGWGAWAGQQRNPKWMQTAKEKATKQRAEAAANRKDAQLKYVVISEKWDKKAAKYTAPTAPFPFTSQEAYERSLRQPLGREYNPDVAFRDLTRPAVLKQAGVAIAPLRYSETLAKDLGKRGKKAAAERESVKVVTVAGGMPKRSKKGA
ncbi:hypothetical protein Agub_g7173 [Astrephomene gubernaculifera]|uniref:Uncharacterized protein n=1 Tax=Astrephomene gubernaculifera TaxID=47775 RepID=A0AAD3DSA1_9CHLO|nr:hypothetical protein Agub_g7173 [Astrephomene gubernaculifera]